MKQPKTIEEFLALPEASHMGQRVEVRDGKTFITPVLTKSCAVLWETDTIAFAEDAAGDVWRIGCNENGLCRHRV